MLTWQLRVSAKARTKQIMLPGTIPERKKDQLPAQPAKETTESIR